MRLLSPTLLLFLLSHIHVHYISAFSIITKRTPSISPSLVVRQNLVEFPPRAITALQSFGVSDVDGGVNDDIPTILKCDEKQAFVRLPSTELTSTSRSTSKGRSLVRSLVKRCDTFRAAGLYDLESPPLVAGAKTNIILFCLAFGYKCYRSIFINKMAVWERQPQWNTVMTSREMEIKANLQSITCKKCGMTIFIAKGRKWFQMPKGYECYTCGATGDENFENVRDELLEQIDDDYFDYEKPLSFVSAAERRKLMKQAGGDEEKANALLQGISAETAETEVGASGEVGKKKKKKKGKKKKKKKKVVEEGVDAQASTTEESTSNTEESTKVDNKETEKPASDGGKSSDDSLDSLDMDNL